MYTLKPIITYHHQLFKKLRKLFSKVSALSPSLTLPSLPSVMFTFPFFFCLSCWPYLLLFFPFSCRKYPLSHQRVHSRFDRPSRMRPKLSKKRRPSNRSSKMFPLLRLPCLQVCSWIPCLLLLHLLSSPSPPPHHPRPLSTAQCPLSNR